MRAKILFVAVVSAAACGESSERREDPSRPRADAGTTFITGGDGGGAPDANLPDEPDAGGEQQCGVCFPGGVCAGGECFCPIGYSGDGINCEDIDECARGFANCPVNSTCMNTVGSHQCVCDPGYTPSGNQCIAQMCTACSASFGCATGECRQRFCDGRFGCYEASACTTIGGDACPASAAWQTCTSNADCAPPHHVGGTEYLRFECVSLSWVQGAPPKRCWPIRATTYPQVEPPPATEPVECPPAPQRSTARVVLGMSTYGRYEWEPSSGEGSTHGTSYRACYLECDASAVCPSGMVCANNFCE